MKFWGSSANYKYQAVIRLLGNIDCEKGSFEVPENFSLEEQVKEVLNRIPEDRIVIKTAISIPELNEFPSGITETVLNKIGWVGLLKLAENKKCISYGVAGVKHGGRIYLETGYIDGTIKTPDIKDETFNSYDSIFFPNLSKKSYAEMSLDEYFSTVKGAAYVSLEKLVYSYRNIFSDYIRN